MKKPKKQPKEQLDYHEGLTENQVRIILREFGLEYKPFALWMIGQTCPILPRWSAICQKEIGLLGVYEYDLFRWIANQKKGEPLIWD